jgi:hypothetical protein
VFATLSDRDLLSQPELRVALPPVAATRSVVASMSRVVLFMVAGAMPVLSIPLYIAGVITVHTSAIFLVVPLALAAAFLIARRSPEGTWALRGVVAGLLGVTAYDALRIPLVLLGIWPDFIPRLGGWILNTPGDNLALGYFWRYLGDGAGISMSFFVFCAVLAGIRPALVTSRPVLLSVAYGIFIWSGLLFTVAVLPRGGELFALNPVSFCLSGIGHLIYGSVLGLVLRRTIARSAVVRAASDEPMTAVSTPGAPRSVSWEVYPVETARFGLEALPDRAA